MNTLEQGLKQITTFLKQQRIPYMIIGGVANMFWGKTRLTQDLDITVLCKEGKIPDFVEKIGNNFTLLPDNPLSFLQQTRVLPAKTGVGVRLDIIFARLPYEETAIQRAKTVKFGNLPVKVCTAEDLIIHKIISERQLDLEDVQWIIKRQYNRLDRDYLDPLVQGLSQLLERPEIWRFYLNLLKEKRDTK